jgi:hypothetical protein
MVLPLRNGFQSSPHRGEASPCQDITGGEWFAILTGDDRRPLPDDGQPAMLLVRAGQAQALLRLERDPLVYFFNALLPTTPDNDPLVLQALQGTTKVAVGMEFNDSPAIGDLPVTAAGHAMERPHFLVLLGDWDTGFLLFLGFNVRENSGSGVAPFDVFQ